MIFMTSKDSARRTGCVCLGGGGGKIAVLDVGATPKLIQEVEVSKRPWGIALTADRKYLYTANGPSNDVSVIETATLKVIKKIPVGQSPWSVALSP